MFMNGDKFEGLLGKTLIDIQNIDNEELIFTVDDGTQYELYHAQDCCEVVRIVDIDGDLNDLLNMPICVPRRLLTNKKLLRMLQFLNIMMILLPGHSTSWLLIEPA